MNQVARAVLALAPGLIAAGCASLASGNAECFRGLRAANAAARSEESVLSSLRLEHGPVDTTGIALLVHAQSESGWEGRWWRYGDSLRVDAGGPLDTYWLRLARRDSGLTGSVRHATDILIRDSAGVYRQAEHHVHWSATQVECSRLPHAGRLPQN